MNILFEYQYQSYFLKACEYCMQVCTQFIIRMHKQNNLFWLLVFLFICFSYEWKGCILKKLQDTNFIMMISFEAMEDLFSVGPEKKIYNKIK